MQQRPRKRRKGPNSPLLVPLSSPLGWTRTPKAHTSRPIPRPCHNSRFTPTPTQFPMEIPQRWTARNVPSLPRKLPPAIQKTQPDPPQLQLQITRSESGTRRNRKLKPPQAGGKLMERLRSLGLSRGTFRSLRLLRCRLSRYLGLRWMLQQQVPVRNRESGGSTIGKRKTRTANQQQKQVPKPNPSSSIPDQRTLKDLILHSVPTFMSAIPYSSPSSQSYASVYVDHNTLHTNLLFVLVKHEGYVTDRQNN